MSNEPRQLLSELRDNIAEAIEVLQTSFIKKPEVDAIVMDYSAEIMARKGIELKL
jgi:hypothetical protein